MEGKVDATVWRLPRAQKQSQWRLLRAQVRQVIMTICRLRMLVARSYRGASQDCSRATIIRIAVALKGTEVDEVAIGELEVRSA